MPDLALAYRICINDEDVTSYVRRHLASITIEESLETTAFATIVLRDGPEFPFAPASLPLSAPVEIDLGYHGQLQEVFVGDLVSLAPEFSQEDVPTLTLTCCDRSWRLKRDSVPFIYKRPQFPNQFAIVEHLIRKHDLVPLVNPAETLKAIVLDDDDGTPSVDRTDWEVLTEIGQHINAKMFCRGDTVYVVSDDAAKQLLQSERVTFIFHADSGDLAESKRQRLLSFAPKLDSAGQRGKVEVVGWSSITASGQSSHEQLLSNLPHDGQAYTDIRVRHDVTETLRVIGKAAKNSQQAASMAESLLRRRADRLVTGQGSIAGNAAIRCGQRHDFWLNGLSFFGTEFTGEYWLTNVRHTVDTQSGFTTEFDVRRDGLVLE